jgi:hypothetical protein
VAVLGRSMPLRAIYSRGSVAPGTKISTLQDDFADGVVGAQWPGNYGTYFETGGFAVVSADTGYSGFQSARTFSLIESELVVQVYSPVRGGATTQAFAEVNLQSDQQPTGTVLSVQFDAVNSVIWAFNLVGFADVGTPTSVPFTPGSPMWVRVKETGGVVSFYASTTGTPSSWGAAFRTFATPAWVTTSAIGVNLQGHRSDGTNDFASFDNVNLGPSDPPTPSPMFRPAPWRRPVPYPAWFSRGFIPPDPPAPQPIVVMPQSGRKPFPLPPGARIMRTKDVRVAPSNRVGAGLDGNLAIPLSVRLKSANSDVVLVAEIRDLTFRSVIPGGFANATVTLDRPLSVAVPELSIYARMYIVDTRSGETVWEGRLEDPGRNSDDGGQTWQVTAVGPSAHARDETFAYIPIFSSLQSFEKFGGSLSSATVGTGNDASGNDGVKVQFAGGITVPTGGYVSARDLSVQGAGLTLGSVTATATGGASGQWTMNLYVYGPGSPDLVGSALLTTSPTPMHGEVGVDFAAGQYSVHLRMDRTGAPTTPDDNAWTMWTSLIVRTTLVDEEGNAVTDYSDDYVVSSQLVADLVGGYLPLYDGAYTFIADTTLQHTQISYPDGTTAFDVLADLMALEGNVYWAAWETVETTGKWRFEFSQWSDEVIIEAGIEDGFDSPGSAADLFNKVLVRWTDSVGRKRTTVRTSTVDVLTAAGLVRTAEISLGSEVGTAAAANAAGDAFLAAHALPSQNGRLTIARPVLDVRRGMMVQPWEVRPGGGLVRVRGVDPAPNAVATGRDGSTLFRIVATSYRASDGSVELELDSDALSTSQTIAQLKTKRTRR